MKNLLVEYKGGGFDGCFWQWNYFMWGIDGKFHNLLSTGYKGMQDENQAYQNMIAKTDYDRFEFNYLNLNRENSIIDFVDNGNASLMSFLANEHWQLGEVLKGHCRECGEIHTVVEMFPGDEPGDGGLAISAKNLYCEDCMYTNVKEWYATLNFENVTVKIGDYSHSKNGRSNYSYVMLWNDEILFTGDDYSPSPMDDPHSLESLIGLLGYFVLRPGDTDDEYFEKYTPKQMEWALSQDCEDSSMIVYDFENGDSEEYFNIDENDNIFTITYNEVNQ